MYDSKNRYLVQGSTALKPDCSRNSNENEHIISFPGNAISTYEHKPLDEDAYELGTSFGEQLKNQAIRAMRNSTTVQDLKKANYKGTPFGSSSKLSLALAGAAYTFFAIAVIYIAL